MKPKAKKQTLGVLEAVLILIFFQLPFAPSASGALYSRDPATQSISNPTGDTDGEGRDISQAFWASDGTYFFFWIDHFGPFNDNRNYEFHFDTGGYPTISIADFSSEKAAYKLKEKVETSKNFLRSLSTWWVASSNKGGSLKDITEPIPRVAWLFAMGVLCLVALKRRRKRG